MLDGKVVVVTGGAKGIGRGCAEVLAGKGAIIVIADNDDPAGQEAEADLRQRGATALFTPTDISQAEPVTEMVERTVAEYGQLDCLLNNAGTHISKTIFDQTEAEWDRLLEVNLKGYFLCVKAALPHLVAAKGNIINMSSMVGLVGQSRACAYAASKGGVVSLSKSIARAFGRDGIKCFVLAPGWVRTDMARESMGKHGEGPILQEISLNRLTEPGDIAPMVALLASGLADHATGTTIDINAASYVH